MNKFGGKWTKQKLDALEYYFNFYINALKNKPFKKIYIDCFAGSGEIEFSDKTKIDGSTVKALNLDIKFDEYFEAFFEGMKKMVKPIAVVVGIYVVFVIVYMSPFTMSVDNWLLTKNFNPYTTALAGFFTSIFHVDFGYTAYVMGSYLTTVYATDIDLVHTIFVTMYGLVQIFMPTSIVLMLGLSLTKVDYKDWLKYIWLFVVGMLIVLLVFFTVIAYI